MKIGLINIDSKIPNLALMKISAWHKQQGDQVQFWNAFEKFDKIYASQVFSESKFPYLPKETIMGGSGWSLDSKLPPEIEHIYPDYSLYHISYAMGYLTRGCINTCGFCIVPRKEGKLHRNASLDEFWRGQDHLLLLDNCITDFPEALRDLEFIRDHHIRLKLSSGFNIRTITPSFAQVLAKIKLWGYPCKDHQERSGQWYISWDNYREQRKVMDGLKICFDAGITPGKLLCYCLVNFNSELTDDLDRIEILDNMGIDPFVMIYNAPTAYPVYHHLARWCNRPQIRHSCSFSDYLNSKGVILES